MRRDAAPTTPTPVEQALQTLLVFFGEAQVKVQEATKNFLNVVGVKDEAELKANIEDKVKTYSLSIQEKFNDIQEEAEKHTGNYEEILKGLLTRLQTEVKNLQANDTNLADATQKYQVRNTSGITTYQNIKF